MLDKYSNFDLFREGVKKPFFWDFVPNYGQVGVQSPKLFSENNHLVILTANPLFLGLCPKIGVAVGGWGSRVPNKYMEFCPKNISLFQKNKTKCPKQPKKQNKPTFHFSLSGVPNVRGGWVGSDVWDKVPKNVFFLHLSL